MSTSDKSKRLPPDLLQNWAPIGIGSKKKKKARSEFQRSARTWGAVVHQGGSPTLAVGPCTRMAVKHQNPGLIAIPVEVQKSCGMCKGGSCAVSQVPMGELTLVCSVWMPPRALNSPIFRNEGARGRLQIAQPTPGGRGTTWYYFCRKGMVCGEVFPKAVC